VRLHADVTAQFKVSVTRE
jgi:hypothetical protein